MYNSDEERAMRTFLLKTHGGAGIRRNMNLQ